MKLMKIGLAVLLVGLLATGLALHTFGVIRFEPETITQLISGAGPWGALALMLVFALGTVASIPGMVFIVAAVSLYGECHGYMIAFGGAMASVNLTFALGRWTGLGGGKALDRPLIKRTLKWLDARPILTLALLRAVVLVSPPVNYALSLTRMSHRDYAVGSALGLVLPLLVITQSMRCFL